MSSISKFHVDCLEPEHRRVILLIDVDAFEIQVYQNSLYPETRWKPCVATNSSNLIVAVSYEAKKFGVSRSDTFYNQAKRKCPGLINLKIPSDDHGSPDYSLRRNATESIVRAIKAYCQELSHECKDKDIQPVFECASSDEFYVDVTKLVDAIMELPVNGKQFPYNLRKQGLWGKSFVETEYGTVPFRKFESEELVDIRLFYGLSVASKLVKRVQHHAGFEISVGVGTNKIVAKLACELGKPKGVTLIIPDGIRQVGERIKLKDIPQMKNKTGEQIMNNYPVKVMNDLAIPEITVEDIRKAGGDITEKRAQKIYNYVRGICTEEVKSKDAPKSITNSKTFGLKGTKMSFEKLIELIACRVKEVLKRAEEERMLRHRVPLNLKLTIKRSNKDSVSSTLSYSSLGETKDEDEILERFIQDLELDTRRGWDDRTDKLTFMELAARPLTETETSSA